MDLRGRRAAPQVLVARVETEHRFKTFARLAVAGRDQREQVVWTVEGRLNHSNVVSCAYTL